MKSETKSTAQSQTTDTGIHSEAFLRQLMKRQFMLSAACAVAFVIVLFGLPLLNYYFPELMARRIGGFTWSWLILGVLVFPFVWIIAWVFIKRSIALEREEIVEGLAQERAAGRDLPIRSGSGTSGSSAP